MILHDACSLFNFHLFLKLKIATLIVPKLLKVSKGKKAVFFFHFIIDFFSSQRKRSRKMKGGYRHYNAIKSAFDRY